jgi:hypothetical protein
MPAPLRGGLVMHVQNAQIHYGGIEQQHTDVELEQTQPAACLAHTQGHNHCIFYCSSQSSANAHHAVAFLARRGYELELSLTHTHTAYELELSLTHTHTAYELEFCKPKLTVVRECAVCAFVRSALALPLTGALSMQETAVQCVSTWRSGSMRSAHHPQAPHRQQTSWSRRV